ncbi:CPBP family glutamic-type intramembrane protease [Kocuria rhizosphaericola]|uniref:CPBP family glutamic-type intramembrane protease n=1 Tax=Kocuria rhizosphaericola TaxID=3376284 RepID=UPI0037AD2189
MGLLVVRGVVVALLPSVVGRAVTGGDGPWFAPGAALVLVTAVIAGVLEEPGWRGYALDALSARHGVVHAAGELVSAPGARTVETVVTPAMTAVAVLLLAHRAGGLAAHRSAGSAGTAPRTERR